MVKFKQLKKKSLVCCVVDNRHLYTSGWATEVSNNISDFLIHRFAVSGYDIFIDSNEDAMLAQSAEDGYSHALIIAGGTSLGLSDRLFGALDQLCETDFFIAGHILQRDERSYWGNAYYELHHQFYVVRLKDYIELGYPSIGKPEEVSHEQIEPLRSKECLYDDFEVAAWIKPGTTIKQYDRKLHGWNIISTALLNKKTLIDLGPDIRNNKKYFYYEYDHVFLREISSLYWDQFFCNNFFPSWNSDQFKDSIPFTGPVEQYITVGIGVYWITYLDRLGVTPETEVVFTDINHNTLQFMREMVGNWDGNNYAEFYKNHLPIMPNGFNKDINDHIAYTEKEWKLFLIKHPNWPEIWNKIKKLKFNYILIDYMTTYDLSWIKPGRRTIVNLSDVFTHSPYIAFQSLKYRISCENKLISNLRKIDGDIHIMMTSRSADGYYPLDQIMNEAVKNFDLTNINLLTKPPWHTTDWTSPRMLG
jgi:hypothetical protein